MLGTWEIFEMIRAVRPCGLALLAILTFAGCADKGDSTLEGAVTYNGEPVPSGSISFMPSAGVGVPFGAKIVDGRYAAEKASAGKFKAIVTGDRVGATPKTREEAEAMAKANQGKPVSASYIPEDAAGNLQEVDVTGASQTLDFAITGPPRQ
jgi:hypothetical protein